MPLDYRTVTEQPGDLVSQEALSMLYTRYGFAAPYCVGKRVLEAACGPGLGVQYLAKHARFIAGGDYTEPLLKTARRSSESLLPFIRMDAQALPFARESVDVVICYEALYYFPKPDLFLAECRRVLTSQGLVLLSTVNPEWPDFNPSPQSRHYYSGKALTSLLHRHGFSADLLAAFPAKKHTLRDHVVSWIKRLAVALHVIPSTMKGKQVLKRVFLGRLVPVPSTLTDGLAPYCRPVPVRGDHCLSDHKILFAVARRD
jgi:2-polyprenyl-3-methyl-5-hydroxy-6-metoxy-1,4-benzoquinol methylase